MVAIHSHLSVDKKISVRKICGIDTILSLIKGHVNANQQRMGLRPTSFLTLKDLDLNDGVVFQFVLI
jgi:hypothetical protein